MPGIYLRQGDGYVAMKERPYEAEDVLQELIERHPEMLAGSDAGPGSLVLVSREAGVCDHEDGGGRWSLDHLYLDSNGVPTLVEVKRSSDTRSRRLVVAQMLDYAANASVSFSAERMADWLEASAQTGADAAVREAFGIDDVDGFWQRVDTNLKAERFRLIFVSDSISPELRSIIEFLNRQMNATEVLAIEVKQYIDDEGTHQTIVPRLVGDTAAARAAKRPGPQGPPLDRDSLVAGIREESASAADAAETLLAWADRDPRLGVRYTRTAGIIQADGWPIVKLWPERFGAGERLEVYFEALLKRDGPWDDERIDELRRDLAAIGVGLEGNRRWPKGPLEPLADERRLQQFVGLLEPFIETLTTTPA